MLCLEHYEIPTVLLEQYGGWGSKHVVGLFAAYAEKAFERYGDRVKYWFTFNEPIVPEKSKPVFVIATANNIDALPPELLRKGRFDEIFFVDLPTKKERKEIFRIHLEKRLTNPKAAGNFSIEPGQGRLENS